MRCVIFNCLDSGCECISRAGKRAVADLQLDDILAAGFESPGDSQDIEGRFRSLVAGELAQS